MNGSKVPIMDTIIQCLQRIFADLRFMSCKYAVILFMANTIIHRSQ